MHEETGRGLEMVYFRWHLLVLWGQGERMPLGMEENTTEDTGTEGQSTHGVGLPYR